MNKNLVFTISALCLLVITVMTIKSCNEQRKEKAQQEAVQNAIDASNKQLNDLKEQMGF